MSVNTEPHHNQNFISDKFKERIRRNIEKAEQESFSSHVLEQIPACVIKVHLERAVFEYALLFKDYTKKKMQENYKNYIVDLSDTLFLDSTFLGTLIFFLKQVKSIGGSLRLVVNSEKMALITQIENISDVIGTFESVNEAIVNL